MLNCKPIAPQPTPTPTPQPSTPAPSPAVDHTAPRLKVALTPTKAHKLTLDERADVTMTATARRHRLLMTTRHRVAAGRRTFTLTAKRHLHRGQKVTLTVRARDAAGNATTRRVTAKVR